MWRIIVLFLGAWIPDLCLAQGWQKLPNAPIANWRHDDVSFVNENYGWVVNVDGNIYRTRDGGTTWDTLIDDDDNIYRCVGFADTLKGWVGNLGHFQTNPNDTIPLLQTNDGGLTWSPVHILSGDIPRGMCGIRVVSPQVIYAVGRVGGPAYLMKSTDGGLTWLSIDMSAYAYGLIDCHFINENSGFVIGNSPGTSFFTGKAVILQTNDGGLTWQHRYLDKDTSTSCWKIDFPTTQTGFVSVETVTDSVFILRTTNGGMTWNRQQVTSDSTWFQGIGFIDNDHGWVGMEDAFSTTDGGSTWNNTSFVPNFNRFRRVNHNLAYAVGKEVWKYTTPYTAISQPIPTPTGFALHQNQPNPFSGSTVIQYQIPNKTHVRLVIYDEAGRQLDVPVDQVQEEGIHTLVWQAPPGYHTLAYYSLSAEDFHTGRLMLIRND